MGFGRIPPGAPVGEDLLETITQPLLEGIEANCPDGVLLTLHGNAMTDERFDVDADFVASVRQRVGVEVPVAVVLDMHANVSPRLAASANIVALYRTTPHMDARRRAVAVAEMLRRTMEKRIRPVTHICKLPLLSNVMNQNTEVEPMRSLMAATEKKLSVPRILSLDIALGSACGDSPNMGMAVACATDGDQSLSRATAEEFADLLWKERAALNRCGMDMEDVIPLLRAQRGKEILLIDSGDNVGGGAGGESLTVYSELYAAGITGMVGTVFAPTSFQRIGMMEGALLDSAVFKKTRIHSCGAFPGGKGSAAVLGMDGGNFLCICDDREDAGNIPALFASGLFPAACRIWVAKSDHRAVTALRREMDAVYWLNTEGPTTPRLDTLCYQRRPAPLYPLDDVDSSFGR